jgi:hypothetical protein
LGNGDKNGIAGAGVAFTGSVKSKLKLVEGGLAEKFGAAAGGELRKAFY